MRPKQGPLSIRPNSIQPHASHGIRDGGGESISKACQFMSADQELCVMLLCSHIMCDPYNAQDMPHGFCGARQKIAEAHLKPYQIPSQSEPVEQPGCFSLS